jgi:sporulation protein YlmC with PRC-barrel domain
MELQNTSMYNLQVKDLNGNEVTMVSDTGLNLKANYPFLTVGQHVRDWQMFIVTPMC